MQHIFPIEKPKDWRNLYETKFQQKAHVFWLTGLSGSGKSTLAFALAEKLMLDGKVVQVLDGDNLRVGLCNNLGFTQTDRLENVRRVAEAAKILVNTGVICVVCLISPLIEMRTLARTIIGENDFSEIFIDASYTLCKTRDPKGLYQLAEQGNLNNFTGIHQQYEPPLTPSLHINTEVNFIDNSVELLLNFTFQKIMIN